MKAFLVQPPFAQLNAPYPAVHYLEAYLRGRGVPARAYDHAIELYRAIFSRAGLERAFADARRALAAREEADGLDAASRSQVERYLSYEGLYLERVEGLVDFLAGRDPSQAHALSAAAELPRGARAEALLEAAGGSIGPERARELATRILEDLADFIAFALDPDFAPVRYAERLASGAASFAEIEAKLNSSYVLATFYEPLLRSFWEARSDQLGPGEKALVLLSVPFPGCLAGALACAAAARDALGDAVTVVAGGGYVSTELRGLHDPGIFRYLDYLAFDAGYGSLASILEAEEADADPPAGLYRTLSSGPGGRVLAWGFEEGDLASVSRPEADRRPCPAPERFRAEEAAALRSTFPDYASADFSRYLGSVDSANPMHRLWSDSPWLKYSLARGCYWRRCAFCDTELEYVSGYARADVAALVRAASAAAARTGLYGIHFVDEAMPMSSLLAFARENRARARRGERPFRFWGNVRFDASWTPGRCELLAASGLVAVSGGIEIATEAGLGMTGKGFDLAGLVERLVSMRRAGLLVHAYLIYGFPGQSRADIVDSAEVCRQLFAAGLVDSAFWHRFVLTRHSRMYAQWRAGGRPELKPVEGPRGFADNDLRFEGEGAYDRFDEPLASALAAWMSGEGLDRPAAELLEPERRRRAGRAAGVEPGLVEGLAAAAEARIEAARGAAPSGRERFYWVAGSPVERPPRPARGAGPTLVWAYRSAMAELDASPEAARALGRALALASAPGGAAAADFLGALGPAAGELPGLLGSGLVLA